MDKVTGAEVIPTNGDTALEATDSGARTVAGTEASGFTGASAAAGCGGVGGGGTVVGSARVGTGAGIGSSETVGGSVSTTGTGFEAAPSPGLSTRHTPQANTPDQRQQQHLRRESPAGLRSGRFGSGLRGHGSGSDLRFRHRSTVRPRPHPAFSADGARSIRECSPETGPWIRAPGIR